MTRQDPLDPLTPMTRQTLPALRVAIKRKIRRAGLPVKWDATPAELNRLLRCAILLDKARSV